MCESTDLNKYRISLPLKKADYVAAPEPELAVQACFPEMEFEEHSRGPRWIRYKFADELPEGWPDQEEGVTGGGGHILDLEEHGTIKVVVPEDD
jgi:hypothetical protein